MAAASHNRNGVRGQREGLQSADIVAVAIDEAEGGLPSEKQVRIYLAD